MLNTDIRLVGEMHLSSGLNASGALMKEGGSEILSSGTRDTRAAVSGSSARQDVRGWASDSAVRDASQQHVSANANVLNTDIQSVGERHLSSGAFGSGVLVKAGGSEVVSPGARDSAATVHGFQIVGEGGVVNAVSVLDGGLQDVAGTTSGTIVSSGASLAVQNGGTALSAQVLAGGTETVLSGGTDSGAFVSGLSARQYVQGGGSAVSATVSAGGQQHVLSGADVQSTFIGSAGEVHLSSGVAVNAFHGSAYGSEVISAGTQDANALIVGFPRSSAQAER